MRSSQATWARPAAALGALLALSASLAACGDATSTRTGQQRSGDGVSGAPTPGAPLTPKGAGDGKAQSGKGDGSLAIGDPAFAPRPATIREPGKLTVRIPLVTQGRELKASLLSLQASQVLPVEYTGADAATLTITSAKLDGPGTLEQQAQTMDFRIDCIRGGTNTRYNNRNGFNLTLPKNTSTTLVVGVTLGRTFPGATPTLELQSPSLVGGGTSVAIAGLKIKPVAGVSLTIAQGSGSAAFNQNTEGGQALVDGDAIHVKSGQVTATGNVLGAKAGQRVELVARKVRLEDPSAAYVSLGEPEDLQTAASNGTAEGTALTDADGDYTVVFLISL